MNDFSTLLIYVGGVLISLSILVLAFIIILPKIKTKLSTKKKVSLDSMKNEKDLDCEEPNGVKINICNDNDLTPEDEELRSILFEKHIRHYSNIPSERHDGKIPIPFESIVFLTKAHKPIVNEDGEIIVTLNKRDSTLVIEEKGKEQTLPKEVALAETDILEDISDNPSDENEVIISTEKIEKMENVSENIVEKKESENEEEKSEILNDGFLTSVKPKQKEVSFIESSNPEDIEKVVQEALKEFGDDDFDLNVDLNIASDFYENNEEETEDDLFSDEDNEEGKVDVSDEEEFEYIEEESIEIKTKEDKGLPKDKAEAMKLYEKTFFEESLSILNNNCKIGSTIDLDEALDAVDENTDQCQEVLIRNMFALNEIVTTTPDKIFLMSRYAIAKSASLTFSQLKGIQTLIFNHLISKKGMKDSLNMVRFITSNPEFIISNPNRPFEFLTIQGENGELCKDNFIKLSPVFIEEIFGDLGSILIKYPPKQTKISTATTDKFCEH